MKKKLLTILMSAAAVAASTRAPTYADDVPPTLLPMGEPIILSTAPPTYNQIPRDYDEFVVHYNEVFAFLSDNDVPSQHKCYPPGAIRIRLHGWCNDMMTWGDPNGRRVAAVKIQRDDGTVTDEFCFGDDPVERTRAQKLLTESRRKPSKRNASGDRQPAARRRPNGNDDDMLLWHRYSCVLMRAERRLSRSPRVCRRASRSPTLFDSIEEPLDQVARTEEARPEADGLRCDCISVECWPKRPFPKRPLTQSAS